MAIIKSVSFNEELDAALERMAGLSRANGLGLSRAQIIHVLAIAGLEVAEKSLTDPAAEAIWVKAMRDLIGFEDNRLDAKRAANAMGAFEMHKRLRAQAHDYEAEREEVEQATGEPLPERPKVSIAKTRTVPKPTSGKKTPKADKKAR